jgi:hypothetical protein
MNTRCAANFIILIDSVEIIQSGSSNTRKYLWKFLTSYCVKLPITKKKKNYQQPIPHAGKLVVTIRGDFKGIFWYLNGVDRLW